MGHFESRRRCQGDNLRPTTYDRAASLIVAMLALVGSVVLVLFGLWLMPQKSEEYVKIYRPSWAEPGNGTPPSADFEPPQVTEVAGLFLAQPDLMSVAFTPEAVEKAAKIDVEGDPGDGSGPGKGRDTGPPPDDTVPVWERWEIRYEASSLGVYARQLDHFGIELGTVGGGRKNVDYASDLTNAEPSTRSRAGDKETRLYMSWRDGRLKAWDQELLRRANIPVAGRVVLQFYPAKTEATLAKLEAIHADGRPISDVKKTIFGVRPTSEGFEYFVKEQRYR